MCYSAYCAIATHAGDCFATAAGGLHLLSAALIGAAHIAPEYPVAPTAELVLATLKEHVDITEQLRVARYGNSITYRDWFHLHAMHWYHNSRDAPIIYRGNSCHHAATRCRSTLHQPTYQLHQVYTCLSLNDYAVCPVQVALPWS
jgi:hypothetical protein